MPSSYVIPALSVFGFLLGLCGSVPTTTGQTASGPDPGSYPTYVDLASPTRTTITLGGPWSFRRDPNDQGVNEAWYRSDVPFDEQVTVPGTWQAQGIGEPDGLVKTQYIGTGWYRRTVTLPDYHTGHRVWLKIGAVHPSCDVYVNGQLAGHVLQPGMPTRFDVTDHVQPDQDAVVAIRVTEKHRGLGNWYNLNASWSGLWRSVELALTSPAWIDDVFVIGDPAAGLARLHVTLAQTSPQPRQLELHAQVLDADNQTVGRAMASADLDGTTHRLEVVVPVRDAQPWSPPSPYLYTFEASLVDPNASANARTLDSVRDRFGLRTIAVEGKRILLNGEPIYLRGVGDDGMYPNRLCPETDPAELRRRMQLIKDCGFNYLYPCLMMQPEEYLDAADEVGLLIQYDAAALLAFQRGGPGQLPQCTTEERNRLLMEQWLTILRWTQNHPSIVIYSPGSELGQDPILVDMYKAAKRKDLSRLILTWSLEPHATDICDVGELMSPLDPSEQLHKIIATWQAPVPGLIHEYVGVETLADPARIPKFTTGMEPTNEQRILAAAEKQGIADLLPQLVTNSHRLANACRKLELEEARKVADPTGYHLWLIQDITICPQGIFDAFWQPKDVTSAAIARSAGPSVLVMHEETCETRRCFRMGDAAKFVIFASHFGQQAMEDAELTWTLTTSPDDTVRRQGHVLELDIPKASVKELATIEVGMPILPSPCAATLSARLKDDHHDIINDWKVWLLPPDDPAARTTHIGLYTPTPAHPSLANVSKTFAHARPWEPPGETADVLIATGVDKQVIDYVASGGTLLLQAPPSDATIRTQFMPRWPLSDFVNISATLIDETSSALAGLPHDGFCDYQFYHLIARTIEDTPIAGYVKGRAEAFNLDRFAERITPIIRVFHTEANAGYLFEARLGRGRVLATTLRFAENVGSFPEATYLLGELIDYMMSTEFKPTAAITAEEILNACPLRIEEPASAAGS